MTDTALLSDRPIPRARSTEDIVQLVPVHVVWEITLACNLKCMHCGSRAGHVRSRELSTVECLDLVDQMAALGTREITLIGGEAYLRRDWIEILRRITGHGILCLIQTGARNLTDQRLADAQAAGLGGIGVSIDGLTDLHDRVRGVPGSFDQAISAMTRAKAMGMSVSVNTQIGAETLPHLAPLMDKIFEAGARHWQIQLTVAMGNAVDNPELLLQPHQLIHVMPELARLYREGAKRGMTMVVGNNIGYFGPYESLWRGFGNEAVHWTGCAAGQNVIGIEADGTIKGCPSLATVGYAAGNIRDLTLADIWRNNEAMAFGRTRSVEADLWGYCRTCYYADVCRAGCTWTSHSLLGKRGNNPYCHFRVRDLARNGVRERIVKIKEAPPESFAVGEFALIEEAIPAEERAALAAMLPTHSANDGRPVHIAPENRPDERGGRIPPQLTLCRGCHEYIWPHESDCPHCGADVAAAAQAYDDSLTRVRHLAAAIRQRLDGLPATADSTGATPAPS
jgi:Y-X(10)_GDL-associated radical SAM protein